MALKRFCNHTGCKEINNIDQVYCDKHKKEHEPRQRQKQYDINIRYKRDKIYHDFYISTEWDTTRQIVINKYKGLCLYSYYILNKIVSADMVHHIEELKENWNKRLDIDNLIPLSNSVHKMMDKLYKKDKIGTQDMLRGLLKRWDNEMSNNVEK